MSYFYGLKRQHYDGRDKKFALRLEEETALDFKDLREKCPPVFDQGVLGSCTANAGVAYNMMLYKTPKELSRLFLYYKERELENSIKEDAGAEMRDICKALQKFGVCEESFWPYNITKFDKNPTICSKINAWKYKINSYHCFDTDSNPDNLSQIRNYIASIEQPVLIGMDVYDSFESNDIGNTGIMSLPKTDEKYLGGHAVLIVGFDNNKQVLIVRNSWGNKWGDKGYFYMPYDYLLQNKAYDSWILSL